MNPSANGNVWFVNNVRVASDANEEMKLLGTINTKHEMVIDKQFASQVPTTVMPDSSAHIALKSYLPNHLIYTFDSKTDQIAVFSEIYYDKGWNAYVNGKKAEYVRANYLLRAMPLKSGKYEIEFKFEPTSYRIGNQIALASSILLVLSFLGFAFVQFKSRKN